MDKNNSIVIERKNSVFGNKHRLYETLVINKEKITNVLFTRDMNKNLVDVKIYVAGHYEPFHFFDARELEQLKDKFYWVGV